MNLYSVCPTCEDPEYWGKPYDGGRKFGDFDKCPKCNEVMDVWTEGGIKNEMTRRQWGLLRS
jgi:hypothetical protein